ncbi:MAG: hypothetical protein ACJAS9_000294 [Polaribacter sp.]|jgi:hypothetical protein
MKIKSLQITLVLFFSLFINATDAEKKKVLYKTVDENGKVTYSDQPSSDSKEIPMSEGQSINMKPPKVVFHSSNDSSNTDNNQQATSYSLVSFSQPEKNGVIRNNVSVALFTLNILPKLIESHQIIFYIDGSIVDATISGMSVTVSNVTYGTHSASFAVLDNSDKLVIKSEKLNFNLLHTVRRKVGAVNNINSPSNKINTNVLVASKLKIKLPEHPKPVNFEHLRKPEN